MAINFPNSPSTNAIHTVGTKSWTFNGTSWLSTAPSIPIVNTLNILGRAGTVSVTLTALAFSITTRSGTVSIGVT